MLIVTKNSKRIEISA